VRLLRSAPVLAAPPSARAAAPARKPGIVGRSIAVAIHGIEPATFERCALIRDWLSDHGIDRVTLLVIPARDLHPVGGRSPEMVRWLTERRRLGDAIAQHGFQHRYPSRGRSPMRMILGTRVRRGEFLALDGEETRRAVHAGWRVLKLAGIEPDGFVAPSYAYTPALRATLDQRFSWWAELLRIRTAGEGPAVLSPAWSPASAGPVGRLLSPALIRACSLLPAPALRLDVHPGDLQHPRHMMALESALARSAAGRASVTYQDLAGS
jgi:predicted deacetylase